MRMQKYKIYLEYGAFFLKKIKSALSPQFPLILDNETVNFVNDGLVFT